MGGANSGRLAVEGTHPARRSLSIAFPANRSGAARFRHWFDASAGPSAHLPVSTSVSSLTTRQIHLLVAQGGNTTQPALELNNALTGQ
jgi:hypothetical protein